jgi:hypothetical protein
LLGVFFQKEIETMKNPEFKPLRAFTGIAKIMSPLKFMRGGPKTRKGRVPRAPRWAIELAQERANKGDGAGVQRLARQLL